jgi:hypothetical protein
LGGEELGHEVLRARSNRRLRSHSFLLADQPDVGRFNHLKRVYQEQ